MKTCILMRHGDYDDVNLSELGKREVDAAAERAASAPENLVPDVILHSPQPRAVETAQRVRDIFARVAGRDIPLVQEHSLDAGHMTFSELVPSLGASASTALVVTHLPNIESLSQAFGRECLPATAGMSVFRSGVDSWQAMTRADFVRKL